MKKLLLAALGAAALLTSCNLEKSWRIVGSVDLPQEITLTDTTYARPSLAGQWVYLCDLDGSFVDSTLVAEDETFLFEGKVKAKEPYFIAVMSNVGSGLIVIEPGVIQMSLGEELSATGTVLNDGVTDLNAALANQEEEMRARYEALADSMGENMNYEVLTTFYEASRQRMAQLLDSVYKSNQKNLVGVYAASYKIASTAESSQQMLEQLDAYSDYVKNSALIQTSLDYMLEMERQYSDYQSQGVFDNLQLIDPDTENADSASLGQ